jgi:hypothetical protein
MTEPTIYPPPALEWATPASSKWEREHRAFLKMLPTLLATHRGKYVAVHDGQVVDSDADKIALALRAYANHGYVPIYVGLVSDQPAAPERHPSFREAGTGTAP